MGNASSKSKYRLLLLGLDSAGKTTVLQRISGKRISAGPTIGFNVATIKRPNGKKFVVWDVGGQEVLRSYWRHYFRGTSAIVFVVDSADEQRFENAKKEIFSLLKEDELEGIPLLVIANKQDARHAIDCDTIKKRLDIDALADRLTAVLPASAANGTGIDMCLEWLGKHAISIQQFSDASKASKDKKNTAKSTEYIEESKLDSDHDIENLEEESGGQSLAGSEASSIRTFAHPRHAPNQECDRSTTNYSVSHSVGFDSYEDRMFAEHDVGSISSNTSRNGSMRGSRGLSTLSVNPNGSNSNMSNAVLPKPRS